MTDNEIVARYDGWEYVNDAPDDYPDGYWMYYEKYEEMELRDGPKQLSDMEYDTDWNWLIPVVKKVLPVAPDREETEILSALLALEIEPLYTAVVQAIKLITGKQ